VARRRWRRRWRSFWQDHLTAKPKTGHVDFVGSGPGDPGPADGARAAARSTPADVVIHDRLVTPAILTSPGARR
jgi:hypothetical protein